MLAPMKSPHGRKRASEMFGFFKIEITQLSFAPGITAAPKCSFLPEYIENTPEFPPPR